MIHLPTYILCFQAKLPGQFVKQKVLFFFFLKGFFFFKLGFYHLIPCLRTAVKIKA